ncbi:aKG-HExxH-type peptide beta-hydroxylase [Sorangium sp. So ce1335]|uniref:aKG-HExxH-type peptide beta-hydroxylase n=1 Tax=Sorangium sp. So ce1335 TaxID=3133335 RepID=UPI003F624181
MQSDEPQVLKAVEDALANSRPFGDCDHIHACTWRHEERRLEMLEGHVPPSRALLAALRGAGAARRRRRVLGDPVVRAAIHDALGHHRLRVSHPRPEEMEQVLREAAAHAAAHDADARRDAPLAAGSARAVRLGEAPHHGFVWCGGDDDRPFSRRFAALFRQRLPWLRPAAPDAHERDTLAQGARLLDALLPELARSALAHTQLVVVAGPDGHAPAQARGFRSATVAGLFGTIVLGPVTLKTPWSAAEHLLHESMHLKFIDLELTHSLLRKGYRIDGSPVVSPPWHRRDPSGLRDWTVNRMLTVLHVYVALALFFRAVERRAPALEAEFGPLGDLDPALQARRSFDRAHFLAHALRRHEGELGAAGRKFCAWLDGLLAALDPSPPPAGSEVHLLLDLYAREAAALRDRLARGAAPPPAARLVDEIATTELRAARDVLAALEDAPPLRDEPAPPATPAERLWDVRARISASLRLVPTEAYCRRRADSTKTPAELVRDMLEGSSDAVSALFRELGPA